MAAIKPEPIKMFFALRVINNSEKNHSKNFYLKTLFFWFRDMADMTGAFIGVSQPAVNRGFHVIVTFSVPRMPRRHSHVTAPGPHGISVDKALEPMRLEKLPIRLLSPRPLWQPGLRFF